MELCTFLLVLDWILDHFDDILNFFFDLIDTLHVVESLRNIVCFFQLKLILLSKLALSTVDQESEGVPAEESKAYFE